MKYSVTREQARILHLLELTHYLTIQQVLRILMAADCAEAENEESALRVLRQLRYMQKVRFETEGIVALSGVTPHALDRDMLAAVDVMLDISDNAPLEIGAESAPFKLRFLADAGDRIGSYGIVVVPLGGEERTNIELKEVVDDKHTVIFILADLAQRAKLKPAQPHYFAVRDGDKYRYYADKN